MKALVLEAPNTAFVMKEVPDPAAGPGEAVARVYTVGAGLTIQHIKAGRLPSTFPRIIGHEITAEIVEVGNGVTDLRVGDAVTANFYLICGYCRNCLCGREQLCENFGGMVGKDCDGGYAEFIKLPGHVFVKLPDGLDFRNHPEEVGVITDALATPYKVLKRGDVRPGEWVAVIGAGGGLGIHQVMLAKWAHARVIAVDVDREKFDACREAGADAVVDNAGGDAATALADLTGGHGVDVVVDYVSTTETLEMGLSALAPRGRLVTLGGAGQNFNANAFNLLLHEQSILGSRYVNRIELLETLELCARGDVWPIVGLKRPWEEAEDVHDLVERGKVTGRAALRVADPD